jgi:hypothetical protein
MKMIYNCKKLTDATAASAPNGMQTEMDMKEKEGVSYKWHTEAICTL